MKVLMMSLLATGVTTWITASTARAQTQDTQHKVHVVVSADGQAEDANVVVVNAEAVADGDGKIKWTAQVDQDDGRSEDDAKRRFVLRRLGPGKDRGWLGVSIANVTDALADQLNLEVGGVLIQNVVEGSPADQGGILVNDILLTVNGDPVEGNVGRAVELVKKNKPGDIASIVVLRDGVETELTVTLGARDQADGDVVWKFEGAPDAEFEDHVRTFGRVLRRGKDGVWAMEDLGDLDILEDLPGNLRMFLPKGGKRSTRVYVEEGAKTVRTRVEEDGNVIVVEQDGDGEITVSRVDADGNETEAVYADQEQLLAADEQAYDLLQSADGHAVFIADGEGEHDMDFHFEFAADEWKEHLAELHEKLEEGLSGVMALEDGTMERIHEALQNVEIDGRKLSEHLRDGKGAHFLPRMRAFGIGKPRHSFEVRSDGTIEVTIRRGDSELKQLFDNEDDLATRKPRLYEKYQKLMDTENDE